MNQTTETELFAAYRGLVRVEECVCGGEISAPKNDWTQIAAAVRLHALTASHQAYRASRPAQPTDRDAVHPIDLSRVHGEGLSAAQSGESERA